MLPVPVWPLSMWHMYDPRCPECLADCTDPPEVGPPEAQTDARQSPRNSHWSAWEKRISACDASWNCDQRLQNSSILWTMWMLKFILSFNWMLAQNIWNFHKFYYMYLIDLILLNFVTVCRVIDYRYYFLKWYEEWFLPPWKLWNYTHIYTTYFHFEGVGVSMKTTLETK